MITSELKWKPINATAKVGGGTFTGPIGAAAYVRQLRETVIPEGMAAGASRLAQDMEKFAQANASWTDRTTDARKGLSGEAFADAGVVGATIVHTVDYGIWLENRFDRRYAIVGPTQAVFAPLAGRIIAENVRAALEGKGSKVRDVKTGRFA
jgi:hypothetical protein